MLTAAVAHPRPTGCVNWCHASIMASFSCFCLFLENKCPQYRRQANGDCSFGNIALSIILGGGGAWTLLKHSSLSPPSHQRHPHACRYHCLPSHVLVFTPRFHCYVSGPIWSCLKPQVLFSHWLVSFSMARCGHGDTRSAVCRVTTVNPPRPGGSVRGWRRVGTWGQMGGWVTTGSFSPSSTPKHPPSPQVFPPLKVP